MTNKYEWPYGLNENVQIKATKTNMTDTIIFALLAIVFIVASVLEVATGFPNGIYIATLIGGVGIGCLYAPLIIE